jgi:hypothetical protein
MKQLGDTAFTTSHNAFESSLSSSTGSAKGERREQSTSHSTSLPRQYVSNVHLQLLIAPLTFVSFLVSLALIDTRNTSLRGNHPKRPEPTSLLGPVGASLHHLVYKPSRIRRRTRISALLTRRAAGGPRRRGRWRSLGIGIPSSASR